MIVWSMYDGSGIMVLPWAEAGNQCYCFNSDSGDHGKYTVRMEHPLITYVDLWIDGDFIAECRKLGIPEPHILFAFPPCTDMSSAHNKGDDEFLIEAALNRARYVEWVAESLNIPWMVENPVGRLSTLWRKPDYYFDPYEYGGYLLPCEETFHPRMPAQDAYTKKTCIWAGGGFIIPEDKRPVDHIGCFWGWKSLGGNSTKTKQLRSLTPRGFARAVFQANRSVR